MAKATSLSEEARLAKARLSDKADARRRGLASRGKTFVTAMFG